MERQTEACKRSQRISVHQLLCSEDLFSELKNDEQIDEHKTFIDNHSHFVVKKDIITSKVGY